MPLRFSFSQRGFTLIELLVVISIIGVLASVVLASLDDARSGAMDAKRKMDLKALKSALEIYYGKYNQYPGETWCDSSIGAAASGCPISPAQDGWDQSSVFYQNFVINGGAQLPVDPINDETFYYYYEPTNGNDYGGYFFRARLSNGQIWGVCGGTLENTYSWCH